MKRLVLTLMLVLAVAGMVMPTAATAFTFEENCRTAIRFNWYCPPCNLPASSG